MNKIVLILFAALVSLSSCTKLSDVKVFDISNVSIENISKNGIEGSITVTASNKGGKVTLSNAKIDLFVDDASTPFMEIEAEKIILKKGCDQSVPISFNAKVKGGVLGALMLKNIFNNRKDKITVTVKCKVKNGLVSKNINTEKVSLNRLIHSLGINDRFLGEIIK